MIKVGMYVSCPVYVERDRCLYIIGKVVSIDDVLETCEVTFFSFDEENEVNIVQRNLEYAFYEIERANIKDNTYAYVNNQKIKVLKKADLVSKDESLKDFNVYYCEILGQGLVKPVLENRISAGYLAIGEIAEHAIISFDANYSAYRSRIPLIEREARLEVTDEVINSVVGTRVFLYRHQLDTIIRATKQAVCRVMLADEVGLGKTIEAISIMKHYIALDPKLRCLIVVPVTLEYQWINELNNRFGMEVELFSASKLLKKELRNRIVVISYEDYNHYYYDIYDRNWGMIIIDEAHKILKQKVYSLLQKQCNSAKHVLLLSATPIMRHASDYLKLLRLIRYSQYIKMTETRFTFLVENQSNIGAKLYDISSDLDIFGEDVTGDLFIDNIQHINEVLKDQYISRIIERLSTDEEHVAFFVRLMLEYVKQKYIIETPIIRHRRNDIPEARIKRCLDSENYYEMAGSDIGVYEQNLYQLILDNIAGSFNGNSEIYSGIAIKLMTAMFSSPYALDSFVYDYAKVLPDYKKICEYIEAWKDACIKDINNAKKKTYIGETRFYELKKITDSIDVSKKVLIFSEFRETVKAIESMLCNCYGGNTTVVFTRGMSRYETQRSSRLFQNEKECRFLVCDESGGEGRNFQLADYIIHFDLPWSPALIEQRIGRLDRIGRELDRDVKSVVICSEGTVEQELLKIYRDVLKVFDRSLCGLEIVFEELQNIIANSFVSDLQFGLSHAMEEIETIVDEMEKGVEEEIYFSNIQGEDKQSKDTIELVINAFDENKENSADKEYLQWLDMVGVPHKKHGYKNIDAFEIQYNNANILDAKTNIFSNSVKRENEIGTFSRKTAIKYENLHYFSTDDRTVKDIFANIKVNPLGRFAAVQKKDLKDDWSGWLFAWTVKPDYRYLLSSRKYVGYEDYLEQFVTEPYYYTICSLEGECKYNEYEIREMLLNTEWDEIRYLDELREYEESFDEDSWPRYIKGIIKEARKDAKQCISHCVSIENFKCTFRDRVINELVQKKSISISECSQKDETWLLKAIENAEIELDSAVYIEM